MVKVDTDITDYIVLNEELIDLVTTNASKSILELIPEIDEERLSFEMKVTCSVIVTIKSDENKEVK